MESKKPRITNTIFKKNKVGVLTLIDFKAYHNATIMKIFETGERIDKWINGME